MKKTVMLLAFAFLAVFSAGSQASVEDFFAEAFSNIPISVKGIGYTDIDPGGTDVFYSEFPVIHGWSRNGYILYSFYSLPHTDRTLIVKSLITDKTALENSFFEYEGTDIPGIAARFAIEPDAGEIGEFPFTFNGSSYGISAAISENADPESEFALFDISAEQNGRQKKIGTVTCRRYLPTYRGLIAEDGSYMGGGEGGVDVILQNMRFKYVKSPFENRIAVVVFIPGTHMSWDFPLYGFQIFGCDLDTGF